ncbi:Alpha-N-arabinofuranosidase [Hymenobacter roseosalivarius DSM 11622]|uniref:Alpha-N-arabinofuranosidase n=1 Tax=Hymenobacter roseosalivarius DSM 11622 TaxID=645990 RepID=A0A1W1V2C0_9BACT|nr:glycoside hydrolase family 43 protein [Hymenobacter roseosalivarius]SMB87174.1 Alpha-N-arabinofuranosidase [Hymenobacter roseosalivarius DSM 11622]
MSSKQRFLLLFLLIGLTFNSQAQVAATFTNPLLPAGADPWSIYKDGYYYYTHTTGRNITLWKTKSLSQLKKAPQKVVWTPPATGPNSKDIWAPELHFLGGKWYLYYAADAGTNQTHRLWVLENSSPDPMQGTWVDKGKISDPADKWAIDGSVFDHDGQLYFVWSGWDGDVNGRQEIYIAKMKNPWTIEGERHKLSTPVFHWERNGDLTTPNDPPHVDVNEGPQLLRRGQKVHLIYSASGCWTDTYALGMLSASATSNLLLPGSWTKTTVPVFQQMPAGGVYAPGHNSFFKSPDGTEDWILYHANDEPGQGCGRFRTPRAQKFTWNADDTPNFGQPLPTNTLLPKPAGEK